MVSQFFQISFDYERKTLDTENFSARFRSGEFTGRCNVLWCSLKRVSWPRRWVRAWSKNSINIQSSVEENVDPLGIIELKNAVLSKRQWWGKIWSYSVPPTWTECCLWDARPRMWRSRALHLSKKRSQVSPAITIH